MKQLLHAGNRYARAVDAASMPAAPTKTWRERCTHAGAAVHPVMVRMASGRRHGTTSHFSAVHHVSASIAALRPQETPT